MQGMARFRALVFFDFVDLLVEPGHHIAVMQQQGLGRRIVVAQRVQTRHQHILVGQCTLQHPLGERLVLDFLNPAKLGIVVPFHIREHAQQFVELDHAVKSCQHTATDHFLQRMTRLADQLGHTGKRK